MVRITPNFYMIFPILMLTACGNVGGINLAKYKYENESSDEYVMCHGYGCTHRTYSGFTSKQWKNVRAIFEAPYDTAQDERVRIAKAIGLMEKYSGALIGTHNDLPKAPIFKTSNYELDCIDETVNTSKYLKFMDDDNLFKYHMLGRPAYRGIGVSLMYPHNTATIVEKKSKQTYVVDSYIYANGVQPDIRKVGDWLSTRIEDKEKQTIPVMIKPKRKPKRI